MGPRRRSLHGSLRARSAASDQCVFTLDYELYGDGHGSLPELVYEPARRLHELFSRRGVRFVTFVEAAELERIEECGTDDAMDAVRSQVGALFRHGFEIGLHLHPQWYNATYEQGAGCWISVNTTSARCRNRGSCRSSTGRWRTSGISSTRRRSRRCRSAPATGCSSRRNPLPGS